MTKRNAIPTRPELPEHAKITMVRSERASAGVHMNVKFASVGFQGLPVAMPVDGGDIVASFFALADDPDRAAGHSMTAGLTLEQVRELRNKLTLILNANGSL